MSSFNWAQCKIFTVIFRHCELGQLLLEYLFLWSSFVLHHMVYDLDIEWNSEEKVQKFLFVFCGFSLCCFWFLCLFLFLRERKRAHKSAGVTIGGGERGKGEERILSSLQARQIPPWRPVPGSVLEPWDYNLRQNQDSVLPDWATQVSLRNLFEYCLYLLRN